MSDHDAKTALFDAFASVSAALSNGRRAEIVDLLAQGERSVEEIAGETGQSVAATSHHLRLLAKSGLARSRREGRRVYYRLASERVAELWAAVRDVAVQHAAEVTVLAGEYMGDREAVEQLTAAETCSTPPRLPRYSSASTFTSATCRTATSRTAAQRSPTVSLASR